MRPSDGGEDSLVETAHVWTGEVCTATYGRQGHEAVMMRARVMGAALAAVVAMMSASAQAQEAGRPDLDTVIAKGTAIVKRAPDRAFVTIVAESRSRQPREAQQANATAMTAVQDRLKGMGFGADVIRTLAIGVQPEYDWRDGRQTLRGYVARNTIEVRIDDLARVGEVVDSAVGAGAKQVQNVRFTLRDMESAEREALELAAKDALGRARALAQGAGRAVDRVLRLDETHGAAEPPWPQPAARMAMAVADAEASTPVSAGEIEVTARVTLTALLR
jgi:uncharacterized protein